LYTWLHGELECVYKIGFAGLCIMVLKLYIYIYVYIYTSLAAKDDS